MHRVAEDAEVNASRLEVSCNGQAIRAGPNDGCIRSGHLAFVAQRSSRNFFARAGSQAQIFNLFG
jgi:hypothetical protein